MSEMKQPTRLIVDSTTKPVMPRYLKLRHDPGRDRWILLAPERILTPDAIAVTVLKLCNGERTVSDIAAQLAEEYSAPVDVISKDVTELLQDMADKGYIKG